MRSKKELNAAKQENKAINSKLNQLTDEQLTQVFGGLIGGDTRKEYTTNTEDVNRSIYGARIN